MHHNGHKKQIHLLKKDGSAESEKSWDLDVPFLKRYTGYQYLLMVSSAIQIVTGLICVSLSVLGLITPLWLATIMSMMGSVLTMLGAYILYDTYKNAINIENLRNAAINRIIKECN